MRLRSITLKHTAIGTTDPKTARQWLEATIAMHGERFYLATPLACGCIAVDLLDADEFTLRCAAAEWAKHMAEGGIAQ